MLFNALPMPLGEILRFNEIFRVNSRHSRLRQLFGLAFFRF